MQFYCIYSVNRIKLGVYYKDRVRVAPPTMYYTTVIRGIVLNVEYSSFLYVLINRNNSFLSIIAVGGQLEQICFYSSNNGVISIHINVV